MLIYNIYNVAILECFPSARLSECKGFCILVGIADLKQHQAVLEHFIMMMALYLHLQPKSSHACSYFKGIPRSIVTTHSTA